MSEVAAAADDRLLRLLMPWIERGQASLAGTLRHWVRSRAAPALARTPEMEQDACVLEPTAFAHAARGTASADELALTYAGALAPSRRPRTIAVGADATGRVFLPGLGYVTGLTASRAVVLDRDHDSPVGYSATGVRGAAAAALPGETAPTVLPYPVAVLADAVAAEGGALSSLELAARQHRHTLSISVKRIEDTWPALGVAIASVVRHVILFRDEARNSFATPGAHGIVFVNVANGTSVPFFVEDLAHQCGHALFTAAWEGAEPLLTVRPDASVRGFTGEDDHRSLEVLMHGMVTLTLMVGGLHRRQSGAPADREEATGRLLFALLRLGLDLRVSAGLPVYTEAGMRLMRAMLAAYLAMAEQYGALLMSTDFTDQPYNFDYSLYRERNDAVRPASRT